MRRSNSTLTIIVWLLTSPKVPDEVLRTIEARQEEWEGMRFISETKIKDRRRKAWAPQQFIGD